MMHATVTKNDDDTYTVSCYGEGMGKEKRMTCGSIDEVPEKIKVMEEMISKGDDDEITEEDGEDKSKRPKKGNKSQELKKYLDGEVE